MKSVNAYAGDPAVKAGRKRRSAARVWKRYWDLYALSLPGLIMIAVVSYFPMYGILIAFKDFNVIQGVWGSSWVGLKNFESLFLTGDFPRAIRNTLLISLYKLIFAMPVPIVLALLLNEVHKQLFKRGVQTVLYIPHFFSWVVISGIFIDLLSPSGIVNRIIESLGGDNIFFMTNQSFTRTLLVASDIWKEAGWGMILYLAAITGIDPELYQAAAIDGAGRFKQAIHITLPGLAGTFIVLLLLRLGAIMSANFEQVFMMYNPAVYDVADIIDTYVYRVAFTSFDFGLTTAAGLFKSVIGCILLLICNSIIKKLGGRGMY